MKKIIFAIFLIVLVSACSKKLPTCEDNSTKNTLEKLFLDSTEPVYKNLLEVTFQSITDEEKTETSNRCKAKIKLEISEDAAVKYDKLQKEFESKYSRKFSEMESYISVDYVVDFMIKKNKINEDILVEIESTKLNSKNRLDYPSLEILTKPEKYIDQLEKIQAVDRFEEWLKSSDQNGEQVSRYLEKNNLVAVKKCALVMREYLKIFEISCYIGNEYSTVTTLHKYMLSRERYSSVFEAAVHVTSYIRENWGMNTQCFNDLGATASTDETKLMKIFTEAQGGISYVKRNESNSINLKQSSCRL
jgi:hypothetical protein